MSQVCQKHPDIGNTAQIDMNKTFFAQLLQSHIKSQTQKQCAGTHSRQRLWTKIIFGISFRGPRCPNEEGLLLIFHFHPLLSSVYFVCCVLAKKNSFCEIFLGKRYQSVLKLLFSFPKGWCRLLLAPTQKLYLNPPKICLTSSGWEWWPGSGEMSYFQALIL